MAEKTYPRTSSFGLSVPTHMIVWLCLAACAWGQGLPADLVTNGSFDTNDEGWAEGWQKHSGTSIQREGGNTWLALKGARASSWQSVSLKPEWGRLHLQLRMRLTDVVSGKEGWQNARLAMSFYNAKGERVGPWPNVVNGTGTTDWVEYEREYRIPRGATELRLNPANFGTAGMVEFDDIHLAVTRLRVTGKSDRPLPAGAEHVWDMTKAWRSASPTRERVCINGLWAFRPITEGDGDVLPRPGDCWGWFKVPGIWPASGMATDQAAQNVLLAPWLEEESDLQQVDVAWYKREIVAPKAWAERRILIDFTMVQSHARVLIDSRDVGEVWFPGGLLDVTAHVRPGTTQTLAVRLTARPIEMVSHDFMAPDRVIKRRASMSVKGLTGDMYLVAEPKHNAIADVHVVTSTRHNTITFDTGIRNASGSACQLSARVLERGKVVKTFPPQPATLANGRCRMTAPWADAKLWDTDTPSNMYDAVVTLHDEAGTVLDESIPTCFGFREFWIEGRDFYLNGRRLHLRALHNQSINGSADRASLDGSLNTCRRMQEYGFNFLITANYSFRAGQVGYLDGLYKATDQTGMLASFSLPHVKDFEWKLDSPEHEARYRKLSNWLIRRVQNHPSIVAYAMNHNATGYYGDQNPLKMDGTYDFDALLTRQDDSRSRYRLRTRVQAALAASIAKQLDPSRPVYHHQSGNLGDMHTVNIYLNWAPRQERSDWLEHWAAAGSKPMFFVEWGLPHISSWSSYRGPKFIWRCEAYQQIWDSEFAAAYVGQRAYEMTDAKVRALAYEERLWAGGKPFRWGDLCQYIKPVEETHISVQAHFADDNWRAHRTWGVSAMLPWDQATMWTRVKETRRRAVAPRYENLQEPGIVPDGVLAGSQYIYETDSSAIEPTSLGRSFLRWNQPLLAYIAGGPSRFSEKSHIFLPGETIHKQLVLLNDSRRERTCSYEWNVANISGAAGHGKAIVPAGDTAFAPISIKLPETTAPGTVTLSASFTFDTGETQSDTFGIDILPSAQPRALSARIALYDPKGATAKLFDSLGVRYTKIEATAALDRFDLFVIGREALSTDAAIPGVARVHDGLNVLVFEQTADALTRRLGFRINIHGIRTAFARVASHPALAGLTDVHLRDWRGAATLTPPHLDLSAIETTNPEWTWCGFKNTRVWRCGNHGNVASVLIEKPVRGDWLPLVDCGFDLQYAPLLACAEGRGHIVFCQLDITGRTRPEPAARSLCQQLLAYLADIDPAPRRKVAYAGDGHGSDLLAKLGVPFEKMESRTPNSADLLVVGPKAPHVPDLNAAVTNGLHVLCLGLSSEDLQRLLPGKVKAQDREIYSEMVEHLASLPACVGVSNAELHWRTKLSIAALADTSPTSSAALKTIPIGKGLVVLCQAAPWMFDYKAKPYLRTTFRRNAFLVSRLLANLGASFDVSPAQRIAARPSVRVNATNQPGSVADSPRSSRPDPWLNSYYVQSPESVDDPYRYYRW